MYWSLVSWGCRAIRTEDPDRQDLDPSAVLVICSTDTALRSLASARCATRIERRERDTLTLGEVGQQWAQGDFMCYRIGPDSGDPSLLRN
jgi:hypothetical protein